MPDLKDERIAILSNAVRDLRANVAAEQAARERAQQALREIGDKCERYYHSQVCPCATCAGLRTIAAMARKGLGETP